MHLAKNSKSDTETLKGKIKNGWMEVAMVEW